MIGANALSILASDAMNRATSFVLYALVARRLGVYEFGQLSLALTLFYVFQVFAVAGLKTFITREVAKDRARTGTYFLNACTAAALTSFSSFLALFGFVRLAHYPQDTTRVILLLSFGLFPYAISAVCEGVFQAWEQMRYIPCVNVPVNAAKIGMAFLVLSRSRELFFVVLILFFSQAAIAAVECSIVFARFPWRGSFQPRFSLAIVRSSSPFLGIDSFSAVIGSLNVLFLSKLANETQVGLFSAAMQLLTPLILVYQSFVLSVFPLMCRKVEPGFENLKRIMESAIELLLVLALPAVAALYFLGDWALLVLYKSPAFLQAFPALKIIAWILVLRVFIGIFGQALVASGRERINLRIVAVNTVVNVLVGWPLISRFGVEGAAVAMLLTSLADFVQHSVAVFRLVPGIRVARTIWKPILAASCMAAYLFASSGRPGILTSLLAVLIYTLSLLGITIWASGGIRLFMEKYLPLVSGEAGGST
jgi:O-antigen/teichoic acid export membrane protein